jgi:hypothetical protein
METWKHLRAILLLLFLVAVVVPGIILWPWLSSSPPRRSRGPSFFWPPTSRLTSQGSS